MQESNAGIECESVGGRHLTLSHCWGRVSESAPWKLTKSHYDHNTVRVPFRNLPRAFEEAVELTCMLGERYIWIDSLCIVQDCLSDWMTEAGNMADIYSQSLCTFSAASNSAKKWTVSSKKRRRCIRNDGNTQEYCNTLWYIESTLLRRSA